jgi:hypothetical protein
MALITYATKTTGDTFTAADANEIKTVVNTNAFNGANTATGTTSVTINATSGVAVFTAPCDNAPNFTDYVINNSLINSGALASKVSVNVQSDFDGAYCSLVSVVCVTGAIKISVNDGFTTSPTNPIISFQILA